MTDEATARLLDRFVAELRALDPVAVWAHGSLAGGDYQEGRSDLDLIAVLDDPLRLGTVRELVRLHRRLRADEPLAGQLHCSYPTPGTAADAGTSYITWAHNGLMRRPVTPVTRRELHAFGRVLHGGPPADLLPPVPDPELRAFVVRDQKEFWRPAVDKAALWTRDVWVCLGTITFARATVTLRDGRLISKGEALDLLPGLGAPVEVVDDIRERRYGNPAPPTPGWAHRRGELTRNFLGPAIDGLVTAHAGATRA
ncbi:MULTISPECIES: nucleotidyltransferase domain-containing protein [unclassified Streptomyces]|uniref:nucleotidyltransferase domain-containing protein n=1 Tax=unclassified Streptomyces TaxID=2593676 RepID=UPI00225854FF|nr:MULTISPECIES: nucleotidyltransferase domain-containing protein [unclassified Streptomyces]MCX4991737.1 nucleotidyltransferase domain-containing protein [Streptomyces sp. NBC_00568]MCX5003027.1 nucleotidyltransferase domain-containing protein [Streptomyces sp. NBC_00638]